MNSEKDTVSTWSRRQNSLKQLWIFFCKEKTRVVNILFICFKPCYYLPVRIDEKRQRQTCDLINANTLFLKLSDLLFFFLFLLLLFLFFLFFRCLERAWGVGRVLGSDLVKERKKRIRMGMMIGKH